MKCIRFFLCYFIIIIICTSCSNNTHRDKELIAKLDKIVYFDNKNFNYINTRTYSFIAKLYKADSVKFEKHYLLAKQINEIRQAIDKEIYFLRNDFLKNLKGNEGYYSDTLTMENVNNRNEEMFTTSYRNNEFEKGLKILIKKQSEMNKISPSTSCENFKSIKKIWDTSELLTAEKFLINLDLTNNHLCYQIKCIYDFLLSDINGE